MKIHLIDGTYELFRAHYGAPPRRSPDGREVGATRGLLRSLSGLTQTPGVTHLACAFDHVIESFRNALFAGYKTGEGIEEGLRAQFPLAEKTAQALGIVCWPMVDFEADDALATAANRWADAPGVEQVVLCSPDKDLAQCVRGDRVVMWDRMRDIVYDAPAVRAKWGVAPTSMADWLALVGDSADGIPGVPRWGAKSASKVLGEYGTLEAIPAEAVDWRVKPRGAVALAASLAQHRAEASLYKRLTTLRQDVPLVESLDDLRWRGIDRPRLAALSDELGFNLRL